MPGIKYVYMQNFMFVGVSRLLRYWRRKEEEEEHGKTVKYHITSITPVLQDFADFFSDIISFQHVLHFGVGRSQIEWNMKVKTEISVFPWANIGQNDHSNPYIESTQVRFSQRCSAGVKRCH